MDVLLPPADTAGVTGPPLMSRRFRQFLPVVIDVETGGFNCATDALLEIAAVMIELKTSRPIHESEPEIAKRLRSRSMASIRITRCARRFRKRTHSVASSPKCAPP